MQKNGEELLEVPLTAIQPGRYQPRSHFQKEDIADLAASIRSVGLIHPPTVRPLDDGGFELISGERRVRAAKLAGLEKIPVISTCRNDQSTAEAGLIENLQRVDLDPMEVASGIQSLIKKFTYNQAQLAERLGKKRSTIANYLRLHGLPEEVQNGLRDRRITMGHAKVILSLPTKQKQRRLYQAIRQGNFTVREAERWASACGLNKPSKGEDVHQSEVERLLRERFQTKVTIQGRADGAGKIVLTYYNGDDLERLLGLLGAG